MHPFWVCTPPHSKSQYQIILCNHTSLILIDSTIAALDNQSYMALSTQNITVVLSYSLYERNYRYCTNPLKELRAILYNHLAMRDMNFSAKVRIFGRFARFYEKNVLENFDFVEKRPQLLCKYSTTTCRSDLLSTCKFYVNLSHKESLQGIYYHTICFINCHRVQGCEVYACGSL